MQSEKNCPVAFQGSYQGKEKYASIVSDAVADNKLWFCHAPFGFAGSCNDINILDVSLLHTNFLDGSHKSGFKYLVGD